MKLKTHQIAAKRFWFSKTGKCLKRKAGQDHFNAKESSKITRLKRKDTLIHKTIANHLKKLIPYH
jgi:ribosomal protein L35